MALAKRFHHNKPLTILDIPPVMRTEVVGLADPETPVGARGVGEPPVGAGYGSVMNAIADAVGEEVFRRAPVTADIVLMSSGAWDADARAARVPRLTAMSNRVSSQH